MAKKANETNKDANRKIFVLDTSVIIFDHNAIKSFQEHDVAIPITVLEELDNFKKGNDTKNYSAREFIRYIDLLSGKFTIQDWIPIDGNEVGRFKVLLDTKSKIDADKVFAGHKNDHLILNSAMALAEQEKDRQVILVTKDINLRIKAKALNIQAEDYLTGKIKDVDNLFTGRVYADDISPEALDKVYKEGSVEVEELFDTKPMDNQYFILKSPKNSALAYYNPFINKIERVDRLTCYGIKPRNAEQAFAMHAILNPDIKLVTVQGTAGTGKTLLALAASIEQRREFKQIYLARPIVPLSNKDIGFLPGDIKSKINPYMEPLWDNLKFIKNQFNETDKEYHKIDDLVNTEKIIITPLAYIRGRSFSNVMFIVDEAQNLTPHEVKTIITRAGEGTKIIFTGDVHQIDTPYLDAQSNGLSYLIERMKGQKLFAHISLEKGERSELANLASGLL